MAKGKQITKDEILSFTEMDQNKEFYVELTRLYYPTAKRVYSGKSKLYIQIVPPYRKQPQRVAIISPLCIDWAEYSPQHDLQSDGILVVEDYEMIIFEWAE